MKVRGAGRILISGSIAAFMPGTFLAVYNGTKAFIDSFSFALLLDEFLGHCHGSSSPSLESGISPTYQTSTQAVYQNRHHGLTLLDLLSLDWAGVSPNG